MKRIPNFENIENDHFDNINLQKEHLLDGMFDMHCGAGCNVLGYSKDIFRDALIENYDRITSGFWKIKNSVWEELEESLDKITDNRYSHYVSSLSGSDAVENAIKIIWYSSQSKNKTILVRSNSYHSGTIAGWQMVSDKTITSSWGRIEFVEFFDDLESKVLEIGKENIAGVLIDTVPWVNKLQLDSDDYWKRFQDTIDKYELTLCVDEILTGVGRIGHWVHSHALGLNPDIVILGKALAGGHENFNLTLINEKISGRLKGKWLAIGNTRSNNTQGALITTTLINHLSKNGILEHIRKHIIPYCSNLNNLLTSKNIKSYSCGTMVQAYPDDPQSFFYHLKRSGLYHNWNYFWHLSFYDMTEDEMNTVIRVIEDY